MNDNVEGEYVAAGGGGAYILIKPNQDKTVITCEWWHIESGPNFIQDDVDTFFIKEKNVWETADGKECITYDGLGAISYSDFHGKFVFSETYYSID